MSAMLEKVRAMQSATAAKAEENRKAMPIIGALVADFREIFGADQVKVDHAAENGRELGKPQERGITNFILLDTERKHRAKIMMPASGKAPPRPINR